MSHLFFSIHSWIMGLKRKMWTHRTIRTSCSDAGSVSSQLQTGNRSISSKLDDFEFRIFDFQISKSTIEFSRIRFLRLLNENRRLLSEFDLCYHFFYRNIKVKSINKDHATNHMNAWNFGSRGRSLCTSLTVVLDSKVVKIDTKIIILLC